MSAHAPTQDSDGDATRAIGTPRNVEFQVFSRITGELDRAGAEGRPFGELALALHENLRLWTIIVTDVTSAGNGLPVALRAQLADLSKFTRSHTQKVLRREADVAILIEINTAVMRGLRGQLPQQET